MNTIFNQYAGGIVIAQRGDVQKELPLPSYIPLPVESSEEAQTTEFEPSKPGNALGAGENTPAGAPNTAQEGSSAIVVPTDASAPAAPSATDPAATETEPATAPKDPVAAETVTETPADSTDTVKDTKAKK